MLIKGGPAEEQKISKEEENTFILQVKLSRYCICSCISAPIGPGSHLINYRASPKFVWNGLFQITSISSLVGHTARHTCGPERHDPGSQQTFRISVFGPTGLRNCHDGHVRLLFCCHHCGPSILLAFSSSVSAACHRNCLSWPLGRTFKATGKGDTLRLSDLIDETGYFTIQSRQPFMTICQVSSVEGSPRLERQVHKVTVQMHHQCPTFSAAGYFHINRQMIIKVKWHSLLQGVTFIWPIYLSKLLR